MYVSIIVNYLKNTRIILFLIDTKIKIHMNTFKSRSERLVHWKHHVYQCGKFKNTHKWKDISYIQTELIWVKGTQYTK